MRFRWLVWGWCCLPVILTADMVELKDGTRIEGRILAETDKGVEIEIGANERGTIRRVLIIDFSEISTWMADEAGRLSGEGETDEVARLGGTEYVDRLIEAARERIERMDYDGGIEGFGRAADIAYQDIDEMDPRDRADMLEKRAHAYRLQLAALKGKLRMLEEIEDGRGARLESMKVQLEKDIEDYQLDREAVLGDESDSGRNLRDMERRKKLKEREEALLERRSRLTRWEETLGRQTLEREQERVNAELRIDLTEEQVDMAEDEAKRASREARRR